MNACKPGHEDYRICWSANLKHDVVQYDYRTEAGDLFSCVATDLHAARAKRDHWLAKQANKQAVYVLEGCRDHEGCELIGVFSTPELAGQVYDRVKGANSYDKPLITPAVLDETWR